MRESSVHRAAIAGFFLASLAAGQGKHTPPRPPELPDTLTDGRGLDVSTLGLDPARLKAAIDIVRAAVDADRLRGAVALLARRGRIVALEAFGWRDLAGKRAMRADSLFRMASNTKVITAAAIAALADDHELTFDRPIHEVFPTFASEHAKRIRIHDLLTHESGLRIPTLFVRPLMKPTAEHPDAPNLLLEVERIGRVGPAAPPGTSYRYSNPGYNTLAGTVERIAEQPFAEFVSRRFYEPLGMHDTCHHESRADTNRLSCVFVRSASDEGESAWRARWKPSDPPTLPFVRGSGGMISTARDYATFYHMLLRGGSYGGKRILSTDAVQRMTTPRARHGSGDSRYGYGLVVGTKGPRLGSFWHSGSDGTYSWATPSRQLIGLLFTQSPGKHLAPIQRAFRRAVAGAITDR